MSPDTCKSELPAIRYTHLEYMFADNPIIHSSLVGQGRKERKRGQRVLGHVQTKRARIWLLSVYPLTLILL